MIIQELLLKNVGGLELYRGTDIRIEADPGMQVQYDGEPTNLQTPLTIRCLPQATRFVVSQECLDHFSPNDSQLQKQE